MQSKKPVEPLDELERDLALTPEENEILWRVRELNRMTPEEYLRFLRQFATRPSGRRLDTDADEPFEL